MSDIPVAVQMYTLRENCQEDFLGTLAKVAAIGYHGVEFAGTYDVPPTELARRLDDLNLRVVGNHTSLKTVLDELEKVVDLHKTLRANWVVVSSLPEEFRDSADGFRRGAARLGEAAGRLAEHGLKLVYHNHAFEFATFAGQRGLDILLGEPAAQAVLSELDVYWVRVGGAEPADYMQKYSGRMPLIHLKDMTPGEEATFAEVGLGVIDFKPIFQAAGPTGAAWYIVEQDSCARPPLESVRLSFNSLRKWGIA